MGDAEGLSSLTPVILHFSELRHFIQEVNPANTMAYDTLPHDWSYQGEVMRKKPSFWGNKFPGMMG